MAVLSDFGCRAAGGLQLQLFPFDRGYGKSSHCRPQTQSARRPVKAWREKGAARRANVVLRVYHNVERDERVETLSIQIFTGQLWHSWQHR